MGSKVVLCRKCGKYFKSCMPHAKYCPKCRKTNPYVRRKGVVTKKCKVCGKSFTTHQSKALYCSDHCRLLDHYVKVPKKKICKGCGIEFEASNKREYHSPECAYEHKLLRERERLNASKTES